MNHKKVPEITKNYINILTTTYKPPLNIMTSLTWHIVSAVGYCRTRESRVNLTCPPKLVQV